MSHEYSTGGTEDGNLMYNQYVNWPRCIACGKPIAQEQLSTVSLVRVEAYGRYYSRYYNRYREEGPFHFECGKTNKAAAFALLQSFLSLQKGWDSYGGLPIEPKAIAKIARYKIHHLIPVLRNDDRFHIFHLPFL